MKHLQVAVGIIRNASRQIFLAQRAASSHMANKWEFPGGKIEQHESAEQALKRELMEETGIEVTAAKAIGQADHSYDDLRVTLHFFWWRAGRVSHGDAKVSRSVGSSSVI